MEKGFEFKIKPTLGIASVLVTSLRVTLKGNRKKRIVVEADPFEDNRAVYALLERLNLPPYDVTQLSLKVTFESVGGTKVKTRRVSITYPNSCALNYDGNDLKIYQAKTDSYALGMLKSTKGRRPAVLTLNPLSVVINHRSMLVSELLYVEDAQLFIDILRINDALKAGPSNNSKPHTPNTDKQQARKLATQAMYGDWQDQYKKLRRENPKKSDVWISVQISKMDIAQGKDSETIRKNMKN